ncbi:hypothetical protein LY28_02580 [Ruminiclostridium sufflavum DSM 19573]|uniref:Uncharacterized protein n=1 Tax=Ruminiclostridium sufflavum DSM 19573 TaxID=1121337 RepID=A0A318XKG6_9FIRM|nr:hypothetical protein [Ruminiclostridium sufflavum]PYG86958.1 hypothetical protein LY28_02580 [Ruminiclostridium sufflavum DSM 19573]
MLRKLFLSIIILSTLASESGVYCSEQLINYYLFNLSYLDVMQDNINVISDFNIRKTGTLERKGTPAAFYKLISQDTIDSKAKNGSSHSETLGICFITAFLIFAVALFICSNNRLSVISRRNLLCLGDSSPPACC